MRAYKKNKKPTKHVTFHPSVVDFGKRPLGHLYHPLTKEMREFVNRLTPEAHKAAVDVAKRAVSGHLTSRNSLFSVIGFFIRAGKVTVSKITPILTTDEPPLLGAASSLSAAKNCSPKP
jgi:hypothetical protein